MIGLELARELLDMGARIGGGARADEQLAGSVALHNILEKHGVAYLADEVGMGKTYVSLGVVALMRHFNPGMRLLVIAPRANIQRKWMKEMRNFVQYNLRFPDLRMRGCGNRPARPMVFCDDLTQLAREVTRDPDRDFFTRISSFSLPLGSDREGWRQKRDALRAELPWLPPEVFDLREREAFKRNIAHALCCALPRFDLVIVDEAHHLKHGLVENVAARNKVLAGVLGVSREGAHPKLRAKLDSRVGKLLLLSATPVEESYRQLWNQLQVLGRGDDFQELRDERLPEAELKKVAQRFLIRRVTQMHVAGEPLTKNLYRREWRGGGVARHDENIRVADPIQRLTVALVQKKVAELLGSEQFKPSFQIGMLASFESFLQTAKLTGGDDAGGNFDDADQTEVAPEREGLDVQSLNRLARQYQARFNRELPHPKMDAVVEELRSAWRTGEKTLVFVRRVASVPELKRKLDEAYDVWLLARLRRELPESVQHTLESCIESYRAEQAQARARERHRLEAVHQEGRSLADAEADTGGLDTFFAWFFRGEGPPKVVSGANVQRRFIQGSAALSTFFLDNPIMRMLGAEPGQVMNHLSAYLALTPAAVHAEIQTRAAQYLSGRAKRHASAERFEAACAAAIDLLRVAPGALREQAAALWNLKYSAKRHDRPALTAPPTVALSLEQPTFFTELSRPARAKLRAALWPEPAAAATEAMRAREAEVRADLLAMSARLGHAFLDFYIMYMRRLADMGSRAEESATAEGGASDVARIHDYLELLEEQRRVPLCEREWGAFDELADIAAQFNLVLDLNVPDVMSHEMPLTQVRRRFSELLQAQQPTAGMWGQVSQRLVRQFRMPGYPFVLITTDVLQEGEDLHAFCHRVQHYGISWTPSSMEQRVGRVDRVRSLTDRRLEKLTQAPSGEDKLQVFYPYLPDTVELLQVRRVLERTDAFLRLMHEGFPTATRESKRIEIASELLRHVAPPPAYSGRLETAFPVPEWALKGTESRLAVSPAVAQAIEARFEAIPGMALEGFALDWQPSYRDGRLLGQMRLRSGRVQPFVLLLKSIGDSPVIRCLSPVGQLPATVLTSQVAVDARGRRLRLGVIESERGSYNLTVEEDVLLGDPEADVRRVHILLSRVLEAADSLEDRHLNSTDQPLERFERELRGEGGRGND